MKRWLLGFSTLIVVALGVAACGGEASDDPAAGAVAQEPAAPVEPAVEPVVETTESQGQEAAAEKAAKKKKRQKAKKAKAKKAKAAKAQAAKAGADKKRQVAVALGEPDEFDLVPAKKKVKAGLVRFKLANTGSIEHEMIVIRTDLDSGELPTDENAAAVEHGAVAPNGGGHAGAEHGGAHVGKHVAAGDSGAVELMLEPGSYALVCNLPGHYASGMHANLDVIS